MQFHYCVLQSNCNSIFSALSFCKTVFFTGTILIDRHHALVYTYIVVVYTENERVVAICGIKGMHFRFASDYFIMLFSRDIFFYSLSSFGNSRNMDIRDSGMKILESSSNTSKLANPLLPQTTICFFLMIISKFYLLIV